MRNIDRR